MLYSYLSMTAMVIPPEEISLLVIKIDEKNVIEEDKDYEYLTTFSKQLF